MIKIKIGHNNGKPFTSIEVNAQLQVWKRNNDQQWIDFVKQALMEQSGLMPVETEHSIFAYFSTKEEAECAVDALPLHTVFQVTTGTYYVHTAIIPDVETLKWLKDGDNKHGC